jgi:hypothetical protein
VKEDRSLLSQFASFMDGSNPEQRDITLKVMEKFLLLRNGDKNELKRMFGIDKRVFKETPGVLSQALKHIERPRPQSLLKLIKQISKAIPVFSPKTDMMVHDFKQPKI